jgi:hypothetical protein
VTAPIRTPVDDIPVEVRRHNWGWFGQPWWSFVCYDETGRLIEEMHKPFPAGENCLYCDEPLDEAAGDSGQAMPFAPADGPAQVRHVHKECQLLQALGPVAHLERACRCFGGHGSGAPGLTARQEAIAVWEWVQQHGSRAVGKR